MVAFWMADWEVVGGIEVRLGLKVGRGGDAKLIGRVAYRGHRCLCIRPMFSVKNCVNRYLDSLDCLSLRENSL